MAEQTLMRLLKTVFPHLKAESGIPPWLFPERSLNQAMDAVGDRGLLRVSQPLRIADGVLASPPDPLTISPAEWQVAVRQWRPLGQFGLVMTAFVEVIDAVMAQFERLQPAIDPMIICRSMAVLLYAPLVDRGKMVTEELAPVLGGQANQPVQLILSYAAAVVRGDIPTLERVYQCILKYSGWREWLSVLQEEVLRCRLEPRLVAVTPPPATDLTGLLATMMREDMAYDEFGNDPAGDSVNTLLGQR